MKTKYWILLFGVLLLLGVVLTAVLFSGSDSPRAEIWSEGKLVKTVDLAEDQTFTVTTETGGNTIEIREGAIRVTEATCPDHVCIERGACSGGAPIVCLPNRLVIRFTGDAEIDASAG